MECIIQELAQTLGCIRGQRMACALATRATGDEGISVPFCCAGIRQGADGNVLLPANAEGSAHRRASPECLLAGLPDRLLRLSADDHLGGERRAIVVVRL